MEYTLGKIPYKAMVNDLHFSKSDFFDATAFLGWGGADTCQQLNRLFWQWLLFIIKNSTYVFGRHCSVGLIHIITIDSESLPTGTVLSVPLKSSCLFLTMTL